MRQTGQLILWSLWPARDMWSGSGHCGTKKYVQLLGRFSLKIRLLLIEAEILVLKVVENGKSFLSCHRPLMGRSCPD